MSKYGSLNCKYIILCGVIVVKRIFVLDCMSSRNVFLQKESLYNRKASCYAENAVGSLDSILPIMR